MTMKSRIDVLLLAGLACALAEVRAEAGFITITTSQNPIVSGQDNQGWWSPTAPNKATSADYRVGSLGGHLRRNFFTFDLGALGPDDVITSATLRLQRGTSSPNNESSETLGFFDVSTDALELNSTEGTNATIFNDLGSGTNYGIFSVAGSGPSSALLDFDLNSAALADLNSSKGGFFSIGGDLISDDGHDRLFGDSAIFLTGQLQLSTADSVSPVPEPSTLALFGMGTMTLAGLGWRRRRRRTTQYGPSVG